MSKSKKVVDTTFVHQFVPDTIIREIQDIFDRKVSVIEMLELQLTEVRNKYEEKEKELSLVRKSLLDVTNFLNNIDLSSNIDWVSEAVGQGALTEQEVFGVDFKKDINNSSEL